VPAERPAGCRGMDADLEVKRPGLLKDRILPATCYRSHRSSDRMEMTGMDGPSTDTDQIPTRGKE
jgi:hypothetical protein